MEIKILYGVLLAVLICISYVTGYTNGWNKCLQIIRQYLLVNEQRRKVSEIKPRPVK